MREPIRKTTPSLLTPSQGARKEVTSGPRSEQTHAELLAHWECLNNVELQQTTPTDTPAIVTVAGWSFERC